MVNPATTSSVIVLFCHCLLFALVQPFTQEANFTSIPGFKQETWLSSIPSTHVEDCFLPLHIICGCSPGHFCSLLHCGPTPPTPLAELHFSFGFLSLRLHPDFKPGFVSWIFFFPHLIYLFMSLK